MRGGSPLAKCHLFVHKTVRDTRHWGKASQTRTNRWSPALSTIPCPPLVSPLECPGDDSLSPNPNQGARGSAFACGKSSSSVLLSPPSHLGHPLPSGFSNVQNAPLPTHSVLGGPQDQSMVPRPPGASGGQSTDPRNAFCLDHPLHQEMGLIQSSCQNPDLQEPGQPSRPLPHQLGTSCYQLHHYCTCPICAGGRGCLFNKPQPTSWDSPRERSLWPTPRPGTVAATPAHSTLCPP